MEPQNKRMRLGTKSCTECRRRKVKCMFDERQTECQQCIAHSLVCQSQYVSSPSSDDKDQMIQELTQFVGQVEKRMASMQVAIDTLASKLDSQPNRNANPEDGAGSVESLSESPSRGDETPEPQLESRIDDLFLTWPTLSKILEYTHGFWMSWPLATMQSFQQTSPGSFYQVVKTFDAGFPTDTEKGLAFIDESLRSQDVGIISKCLVWLCLSFQQLPRDFEDTETGLPLCSQELITRYLAKVDAFYLTNSKPVCSIDFVEVLVLQHELFISMGRPSKAWKCIRAGIENAMLLGLHRPGRSTLERGVWEALWIRDRQLSLFLGLPYAVPEHLTLKTVEDNYHSSEKEVFRKIATISGHIIDRDQLRQDAPYSATSRIAKEMAELKAMIPDHWGTQSDSESAFSLAQVLVHINVRLLYHTINQMLHLPYAQPATQNKKNERDRAIVLESAEGAIQAYQDLRALDIRPYGPPCCEFFDFLAFSAAAILAIDLASQETSRPAGEEQRLWTLITALAYMMNKVGEVLDNTVGDQSADVLENFEAACNGTFTGFEPYEATIPYFGRIKISQATEKTQHHTRQHSQSETTKNIVELESNVFNFRLPNEYVAERELAEDWTERANDDLEYDWKGVYEFLVSREYGW